MKREKTPISKNQNLSDIIYIIGKNKLSSTQIANKLGKKQPLVYLQLARLLEEKYLNLTKETKQFNQKLYYINWDKIAEVFYTITKKSTTEGIKKSLDQLNYKESVKVVFEEELFKKLLLGSFERNMNNINLEEVFFSIVHVLGDPENKVDGIIKNKTFLKCINGIRIYLNKNDPVFILKAHLYSLNQTHL